MESVSFHKKSKCRYKTFTFMNGKYFPSSFIFQLHIMRLLLFFSAYMKFPIMIIKMKIEKEKKISFASSQLKISQFFLFLFIYLTLKEWEEIKAWKYIFKSSAHCGILQGLIHSFNDQFIIIISCIKFYTFYVKYYSLFYIDLKVLT